MSTTPHPSHMGSKTGPDEEGIETKEETMKKDRNPKRGQKKAPRETKKAEPQTLHECLKSLFDELGLYKREEWASILNVSPATLSNWTKGIHIPKPDYLKMIVRIVDDDPLVPEKWLKRFEVILSQPTNEVVQNPNSKKDLSKTLGPTLRHYMLRPLQESTLKWLATLPVSTQEKLLYELADWCDRVSMYGEEGLSTQENHQSRQSSQTEVLEGRGFREDLSLTSARVMDKLSRRLDLENRPKWKEATRYKAEHGNFMAGS